MAFTYTGQLDTALDRVRYAVGDITSPGIFADATYTALISAAGDDEEAAIRAAAAGLAAWGAAQPSSLTDNGTGLTWGERVAQWNKIALGEAGLSTPQTAVARSPRLGRLTAGCGYRVH